MIDICSFSANRQFSSKSFSLDNLIERLRNGQYKRIVVLAGAGISTPSGIPDFRYLNFFPI